MKKSVVIDKLLLILIVVSSLAVGLLLTIHLERSMTREWTNFIIDIGIIYPIMLLGLTFGYGDFRRYSKIKLLLYQGTYYCVTFGAAYLIFASGLLPMPESHHMFVAVATILSLISMVLLTYCVRKAKFFQENEASRKDWI